MTSESLGLRAGVVLSLFFSFVPGLSEKFAVLSPVYKRLVLLGALLAITLGAFGIACLPGDDAPDVGVTCDQAGAWKLLDTFIMAAVSSQGTYGLTIQAQALRGLSTVAKKVEEKADVAAVSSADKAKIEAVKPD